MPGRPAPDLVAVTRLLPPRNERHLGCVALEDSPRETLTNLLAQPIVLSLEAIMLALRVVALALGAFRPFSQVFDLTSGPIVQGWVA